jgi:hypothetical protein
MNSVATVLDGMGYANAYNKPRRVALRALEIILDPVTSKEFLRRMGEDIEALSDESAQTHADKLLRAYGGLPALPTSRDREEEETMTKAKATPAAPKAAFVPTKEGMKPCREGSKQQILIDGLHKGSTIEALAGMTGWTTSTVRGAFGLDVKNKGYGVKQKADGVFKLVLPKGVKAPLAPTPLKKAAA